MGALRWRRHLAALAAAPIALVGLSGTADASQADSFQRSEARAPVFGTERATAVDDQYVVVMQDGTSAQTTEDASAEATSDGGEVHAEYSTALKGFAATLPADAVEELRGNPDVAYIEADQTVTVDETQSPATWGLDRIDQRSLPLDNSYTYNTDGSGVTAYIIDTGILFSHQEFGGRATSGFDSVDGGSADDCNGHGTHVAGTVGGTTYGVAKAANLVGVRVLDCAGSGTVSGVVEGIDWVTSNHEPGQPAVANMSLGGGASTAIDDAVSTSIADGVTYAIAAGNESADACGSSPARVEPALTVGATTSSDARASFSNTGSCVDIFAPGEDIESSWNTSDTATNTISGTSMATPHVAGAAALYLTANPTADPAAVAAALVGSGTPDLVGDPGTGSPNLLLYTLG